MTTKSALLSKIDSFLEEHRPSRRGGWAEISREDVEKLDEIIEMLVDLKADRDADGDRTVQWTLTNRREEERMPFANVPYFDKDPETHFSMVELNFEIAFERFRIARKREKLWRRGA